MRMNFEELASLCKKKTVNICSDSRQVRPGDVFVALPGEKHDGNDFIRDAMRRGAAAIVCRPAENALGDGETLYHFTDDPQAALIALAKVKYDDKASKPKLIGITGTNGKTTCAYLLEHLFKKRGERVGVFGTVSWRWPGHEEPARLTTPDVLEIHSRMHEMAKLPCDRVIMEVSSHALAKRRVEGLEFDGAIFTNLTQDHLDFHSSMENYYKAKEKLFLEAPKSGKAVAVNTDDEWGRRLCKKLNSAISYGLGPFSDNPRHLSAEIIYSGTKGSALRMKWEDASWEIETPLIGSFNALNLLAVQALALGMGVTANDLSILSDFAGVRGRMERIINSSGLNIFVDYAHTPDALANVLNALKQAGFKRIITVFGCGGDRDKTKRPLMGAAVARSSDIAFITSDNPRFEEPLAIIDDIKPGMAGCGRVFIEPDRKTATSKAIDMLEAGDALLVAGKGHEDYQIIKDQKNHYSDQEIIREYLNCV